MAITKIQSESMNLADTYAFTGTVTGAGESNTPSFFVRLSSDQSVSNSAQVKVQHDTVIVDTASAFDNTTNYRFTVPSGQGGKYLLYACMGMHSATNAYNSNSRIVINGSTSLSGFGTGTYLNSTTELSSLAQAIYTLSAGDYVEHYARTDVASGSAPFRAATMSHSGWSTYFGGFKISS